MKSLLCTVSLMLTALSLGTTARAVTYAKVEGHSTPVTVTTGSDFTIQFDRSKPGYGINFWLLRDLAGTGKYDPMDPAASRGGFVESGNALKVSRTFTVDPGWPAGPYILRLEDVSDLSTFDLPLTIVPHSQPQAISGRVAVVSAGGETGTLPPDAIIWAYSNSQTPAASADMQPDRSYTLPLRPGTYIVFAEWYGSLRSQRQVITVAAGQAVANVDLPLLHGQEVSGTLKDDQGKPLANAPVQATPTGGTAAGGTPFTTQTVADGSYLLVLPAGQYNITGRGSSRLVTVADQPVDGVDFPPAAPGPAPAVGTILTVAGDGIPGFGGDGGSATSARLNTVIGIAVDKAGNLYLAENNIGRIRKVDPTGQISTVAGSSPFELIHGLFPLNAAGFGGDGGPAAAAQLNFPKYIAVDAAGNLYFSDTYNNRVRKVEASTGIITTIAGSGPAGEGKGGFAGDGGKATAALLNAPQGVALDAIGNLYIVDGRNKRVRKVGLDGIITTVAGGGTASVTSGASATAVSLGVPFGVAVDLTGNLYIVDIGVGSILKVSPSGAISRAAQLGSEGGLAVDSTGNLFFADTDNNRIRKISPDRTDAAVAGNGSAGFAGDGGPATKAKLTVDFGGLAADQAGNLYIADSGNQRVRKVIGIAAPGVIGGQ
jgi:NHL repeat-containing protein